MWKSFFAAGLSGLILSGCASNVKYSKNFKTKVSQDQQIFLLSNPPKQYKIVSEAKYKTPIGKNFNSPSVRDELLQLAKKNNAYGVIVNDIKTKIPIWGYVTAVLFYVPVKQEGTLEFFNYLSNGK